MKTSISYRTAPVAQEYEGVKSNEGTPSADYVELRIKISEHCPVKAG